MSSETVDTILSNQLQNADVVNITHNEPPSPAVLSNPPISKVSNPNQSVSHLAEKPVDLRVDLSNVNQIVDCIVDLLDGRKLTSGMIIRVVANCMKTAAQMKVSNNIKKKIVIAGIEKFIKEKSGLSEDEVNTVMAVVDTVVSEAIDTLADVHSGKLSFKKACCPCF